MNKKPEQIKGNTITYDFLYDNKHFEEGVGCKHQMSLANQGIHWCELQQENYPNCKDCPKFERRPGYQITGLVVDNE